MQFLQKHERSLVPLTYLCLRSPRHRPGTQTVAAAGEEASKTHQKHSLQKKHLETERQFTAATPENSRILGNLRLISAARLGTDVLPSNVGGVMGWVDR